MKRRGFVGTKKLAKLKVGGPVLVDGIRHKLLFARKAIRGSAPWLVIARNRKETAVTADKVKAIG